ncbi:GntR family transcriptional regulator [Rhodoblastus sphagnicola]|uniref:GntR family transcriptional regulator n=1 Tax=Rhodoblastus sphagnicola TaxID=333368 RepID=A0A2S6MVP8_9HYPH|nr:GntR family transcriptional regulator [Rhodoblastus sphagnicola]PPQ26445.1 GntR family transcriptional regulator [Rhodoblastus sphagnicola]
MLSSERLIESLAPDRGLAEPVYKQMARAFNKMLETGEIGEGQSLPAERLLAEKLDLSRTTVRRFYEELRKDDLLSTSRRSGAVTKAPPRLSPRMGRLKGFTDEMRELGVEASTRVLSRDIVRDRVIASVFNRPSTAHFLKLVRLRLGDGAPLSREIAWFDLTLAPDMADWNVEGSAYHQLSHVCGVRLGEAEQSIEAVLSSDEENAAFGFETPQPCLLIKRKTRATSGQIVEYVEGTFRGDSYTYRLNLEPWSTN